MSNTLWCAEPSSRQQRRGEKLTTADSTDPSDLTATEQLSLLNTKELSANELLDASLARIESVNGAVNALVDIRPDEARAAANAVDAARASGDNPGALGGLVMAHKDLAEVKGFLTTYATQSRRNNMTTFDAHHVARMRGAGGVTVAKTNSPEFGAGSHTFNAVYGLTRNPWNLDRSAGGSSGGAAVGLATGMVALADGSDQGGSLRNPAAWAGVVGFRPTPGVVPKVGGNGWNPNTTSGPMARTVDDLALLLGVMNEPDEADPLWAPVECTTPVRPLEGARVAWSDDLGGLPIEAPVRNALRRAREVAEAMSWETLDAEPDLSTADGIFETLRHYRQPAGLAPFSNDLATIKAVVIDELEAGQALTGQDVDNAFIALGQLRQKVLAFFDEFDLLVAPVTQIDPFPVEWEYPTAVDGVAMQSYVEWMRACSRVTVLGAPAISVPIGLSEAGLPVGLQIVGRPGADAKVLQGAKAIEQAMAPLPQLDVSSLDGVVSDPWVIQAAMR